VQLARGLRGLSPAKTFFTIANFNQCVINAGVAVFSMKERYFDDLKVGNRFRSEPL